MLKIYKNLAISRKNTNFALTKRERKKIIIKKEKKLKY